MGLSFPILQRAVHDDPRDERPQGRASCRPRTSPAASPGACWSGSCALERLGTPGTLRAAGRPRRRVRARRAALLRPRLRAAPRSRSLVLAWALPGPSRSGAGCTASRAAGRSPSSTRTRRASWRSRRTRAAGGSRSTGKGNSWLPYGSGHTLLGAMPAIVHPAPLDVAVVGLGSGDTAWASAWRDETALAHGLRDLVAAAAHPLAPGGSRRHARHAAPARGSAPAHPHRGRPQGARSRAPRYDLIETDATWPETRGQRQPLLGRVLPGGGPPAEAGRCHVHLGADPAGGGELPGGVPARARGGGRRRPDREPRRRSRSIRRPGSARSTATSGPISGAERARRTSSTRSASSARPGRPRRSPGSTATSAPGTSTR